MRKKQNKGNLKTLLKLLRNFLKSISNYLNRKFCGIDKNEWEKLQEEKDKLK